MVNKIPHDIEEFHAYISTTDDCQVAIDTYGFSIIPLDANGKKDFSNPAPREKIINQPTYWQWEWTADESMQWTAFRKKDNELYQAYKTASGAQKQELKKQLEENINKCIEFDKAHALVHRVANSWETTAAQRKIFGIKQDILTYPTPLRNITFEYEKEIPLNEDEKEFIEKYIALHHEVLEQYNWFKEGIKQLHEILPTLWEKLPVAKDKFDLAMNKVFIPPPVFKGSFSEWAYFQVPTAEEQQQRIDDVNAYVNALIKEVEDIGRRCTKLEEIVYEGEDFAENEDKTESLYSKVGDMQSALFDKWQQCTIDGCSLEEDWQNFLGARDEPRKEMDKLWEDYIYKHNLFMDVYNALIDFISEKNENQTPSGAPIDASNPNPLPDDDDPHTETLKRHQNDLQYNTNTYYDVLDWHIIIDQYDSKYDHVNKLATLEKALNQHPNEATLLIRKAMHEADAHRYKEAVELFKQVESQGGPYHPNFYFGKANMYAQMQAPEQAIPLYNKLIKAEGPGLEWWHWNARERLTDIYYDKGNFAQCIRIGKEMLAIDPDNENANLNQAIYYKESGNDKEAEDLLVKYIEKFPQSAAAIEQLGHIYYDRKEYDKAIKQYDHAYEIDKRENYGSLFHMGDAYMQLKRFADAAICFETCLFNYKLDKDYHLRAAACYAELKVPAQATYHYRMALKLDPDCSEALKALQAN